jgi:hypothetical protein
MFPVRGAAGLVALLLLILTMACAQDQVVTCLRDQLYNPSTGACEPCPKGQIAAPALQRCVPEEAPDAAADLEARDGSQDLAKADTQEDAAADQAGPQDQQAPDASQDLQADAPGPDTIPQSPSGGPCALDAHCPPGESCLDWPSGYCALLGCGQDEDCGPEAHCIPLLENGAACFQACGDRLCREGYACKQVPFGLSGLAQVCHPFGGADLFAPCSAHSDCAGALSCLPAGGGLRCLLLGCPQVPCPEDAACIEAGNLPLCLRTCDSPEGCPEGFTNCRKLPAVAGGSLSVCATPAGGLGLGETCRGDLDCGSAFCLPHQRGACSDDGAACFDDLGCQASVCLYSAALFEGSCTDTCGPENLCSTGLCVGGSGGATLCVPMCNSGTCPSPAQTCIFGDTLYPPAPGGRFGCLHQRPGSAGTPCQKASDCELSGNCLLSPKGPGYCAPECDAYAPECPFGTTCQKPTGDTHRCLRRCKTQGDCPPGFTCQTPTWAGLGVCL